MAKKKINFKEDDVTPSSTAEVVNVLLNKNQAKKTTVESFLKSVNKSFITYVVQSEVINIRNLYDIIENFEFNDYDQANTLKVIIDKEMEKLKEKKIEQLKKEQEEIKRELEDLEGNTKGESK